LRELRAVERQYNHGHEMVFAAQIDRAREAFDRGDREQALTIWHRTRALFPELSMTSEGALQLLLNLGAFDEADALIQKGWRRYPRDAHLARGYVRVAYKRGNQEEALRRCEIVRRKSPRIAEGYTTAAACLTDLGRHQEAEAMIERAVRKLPRDYDVLVDHARHAVHRKDWQEALRRWEAVKSSEADRGLGLGGVAQCLREMGHYDEAEGIATEMCERFPTNPWGYAELAAIAAARGDLEGAAQRWEVARKRCPFFVTAYTTGAEAARRVGREAEADEILGVGARLLRSDLGVHLEYARNAHRHGDWPTAVERWALVRERFPECAEAREQEARALAAMEGQGKAARAGNDQPSSS
jgi:tetratricopeptide (TPR) repeat protein